MNAPAGLGMGSAQGLLAEDDMAKGRVWGTRSEGRARRRREGAARRVASM